MRVSASVWRNLDSIKNEVLMKLMSRVGTSQTYFSSLSDWLMGDFLANFYFLKPKAHFVQAE